MLQFMNNLILVWLNASLLDKEEKKLFDIEQIMDAIYQEFSNQNYYTGITKFMTILENYDTITTIKS